MAREPKKEVLEGLFKGDTEPQMQSDSVKGEFDFPPGTTFQLDTKKYLWGVLGHHALTLPVRTWDEVYNLVDGWYEFQLDLGKEYEAQLTELYKTAPDKPSRQRTGTGDDDDKRRSIMGVIYGLGSKKGVYVNQEYPNIRDYTLGELYDLIEELKGLPDKGQDAGEKSPDEAAKSRVRSARRR